MFIQYELEVMKRHDDDNLSVPKLGIKYVNFMRLRVRFVQSSIQRIKDQLGQSE